VHLSMTLKEATSGEGEVKATDRQFVRMVTIF
jgi:hypothetical protein